MSYRLLSGVFGDPGNGVPDLFGSDGRDASVKLACTVPPSLARRGRAARGGRVRVAAPGRRVNRPARHLPRRLAAPPELDAFNYLVIGRGAPAGP